MRRTIKVKIAVARVPMCKAATAAAVIASPRRTFPSWIDANERGVSFAAVTVTPRVRDGLVLRLVGKQKSVRMRTSSDGSGAR
jgi:hypothetical protein